MFNVLNAKTTGEVLTAACGVEFMQYHVSIKIHST